MSITMLLYIIVYYTIYTPVILSRVVEHFANPSNAPNELQLLNKAVPELSVRHV